MNVDLRIAVFLLDITHISPRGCTRVEKVRNFITRIFKSTSGLLPFLTIATFNHDSNAGIRRTSDRNETYFELGHLSNVGQLNRKHIADTSIENIQM